MMVAPPLVDPVRLTRVGCSRRSLNRPDRIDPATIVPILDWPLAVQEQPGQSEIGSMVAESMRAGAMICQGSRREAVDSGQEAAGKRSEDQLTHSSAFLFPSRCNHNARDHDLCHHCRRHAASNRRHAPNRFAVVDYFAFNSSDAFNAALWFLHLYSHREWAETHSIRTFNSLVICRSTPDRK